jgi:hypothetical protein
VVATAADFHQPFRTAPLPFHCHSFPEAYLLSAPYARM